MAWTQADLDALQAAYASGTLQVRFSDGRMVTYPSGEDLLARIREVRAQLATASGVRSPMTRLTSFSRG